MSRLDSGLNLNGMSRHSLLVNFSVLPVTMTVTLSCPAHEGVPAIVGDRSPE